MWCVIFELGVCSSYLENYRNRTNQHIKNGGYHSSEIIKFNDMAFWVLFRNKKKKKMFNLLLLILLGLQITESFLSVTLCIFSLLLLLSHVGVKNTIWLLLNFTKIQILHCKKDMVENDKTYLLPVNKSTICHIFIIMI